MGSSKISPEIDKKSYRREAGIWDIMRGASCFDVLLLLGGIFISVINGAVTPFNSFIFQGITDTLITGEQQVQNGTLDVDTFTRNVLYYCSLYLYLGVTLFILGYVSNACMFTLCERRVHYLRSVYLKAVMRQDMHWYDTQQTGALTQRMTSGIDRIKAGVGDKIGIIFMAIGCFVSGIAVGLSLSWQMTIVMLFTVPLQLGSMYLSGKFLNRASKSEQSAYSTAGGIADEVISGIKTVISFNAQPYEINRYEAFLTRAKNLGIRKAYVLAAASAFPLFLMFAAMAVAFWYGTTLVMKGTVNAGAIFGVFWAVMMGTRRLGEAAPQLGVILSARLAARDLFQVIDRIPDIDCTREDGLAPADVVGRIGFSHVEFSYPTRPDVRVLKGVNFEADTGETIALVGHSGCGKSTTIGLLLRFYDQDAGVITLDDIPIREYNINWLRNVIGVVQQEPVIFLATVEENIRLGDERISNEDVLEACKMANAHEFIAKLPEDYSTMIGDGAVQLSGGQKQRIAIARALARKPKVLLLDEATSALDTESEFVVQEALNKARLGRTTICIAHRLSTVRNADKILVFDSGNIIEEGTHEELMEEEDGVYKSMVKAQEIAKGEEDTTLADVEPVDIRRAIASRESGEERRSKIERESARLRQSMISTTTQENEWEIESAIEEMKEEGAMEASFLSIFAYAKQELPLVCLATVITVIRGLTMPAFAIIYGQLFRILTETNTADLSTSSITNSLWFLLLAVVSGITTFGSGSIFGKTGENMALRLRMDVFKNLLRQDASYYDEQRHSTGNLTSRLAVDAPNVQAAIDQRLAEVLQGVFSVLAAVCVAFYFGWNMAPMGVITAGMLVAAQGAVAQYLKFRGQKDIQCAEEASRIVTEAMSNTRTIQALTRQDYICQAFDKASVESHRRAVQRGLVQSLTFALGSSFVGFNFAITYAFGLLLIRNGWSTPFTVFQVIEALNMASFSVLAAASYFPEYVRARISAGIMFTMMRQKPKIDNMSPHGETPDLQGNLAIQNVYFSYPNRRRCLVLGGITVSAKSGQTVALVGPSGCGKSTVLQLLQRHYDPLCGSVQMDSYDFRDISVRHLRDQIAVVGQEPTLFDISIRDNIAYGLDSCSQEDIEKAAKLANIHAFIASLPEGYDTPVGARGGHLSGGQKQRIAIARAMVRDPKVLLLDEATSALDTESEKVVQEALDRARLGRTCVVIAHRLSTIQNADQIIVCRDGKAVEKGTHQSLLARKGLYYRLVERQQKGLV